MTDESYQTYGQSSISLISFMFAMRFGLPAFILQFWMWLQKWLQKAFEWFRSEGENGACDTTLPNLINFTIKKMRKPHPNPYCQQKNKWCFFYPIRSGEHVKFEWAMVENLKSAALLVNSESRRKTEQKRLDEVRGTCICTDPDIRVK